MDFKGAVQTLWNRRSTILVVLGIGLAVALIADLFVRATFTANASVLMVPGTNESDGVLTTAKPLQSDDLPMLALTSTVLDGVARSLGDPSASPNLSKFIRADVYQDSNVMNIRFSDPNPDRAILGANAVADQVVDYYRTIATSRYDSLADDIRRQLKGREQELRQIDTQLDKLTASYPYIEDGAGATDGTSMNARLIQLQAEHNELSAALSGDIAQAGITEERLGEVTPLARQQAANDDPVYRNAREQYAKDVAELRYELTRFTPAYPGVIVLKEAVAREQAGLLADQQRLSSQPLATTQQFAGALAEQNRAQALVANDRAKLQQIDSSIAELQSELKDSTNRGTAVEALRRQRASAQGAYQLLSTRLISVVADRAAVASTGSLMVLDRASAAGRAPYTQPLVITSAVMMVALWVAITLAFVLEALDRRFRTLVAIEAVYGSPVLGTMLILREQPRALPNRRLALSHRASRS